MLHGSIPHRLVLASQLLLMMMVVMVLLLQGVPCHPPDCCGLPQPAATGVCGGRLGGLGCSGEARGACCCARNAAATCAILVPCEQAACMAWVCLAL